MAQQLVNGLMLGSIYVLVAVSLTLSIGILNFLNFSIPGMFMLGGVLSWLFIQAGFAWPLAVVAALILVCISALVVERFTYRWMKGSDPEVPLVSSLGFLILFENLMIVAVGSDQQAFPQVLGDFNLRIAGLVIGGPQLISLGLSLVLVAMIAWLLRSTQYGRRVRAIAENPDTATILGVNLSVIVPTVFIASGLLAAIAGVLFAFNYLQVSPFMGEEVGLKGISAMIVGGMGNVWGAVVGGLLIGLTEVFSIYFLGSDFVDITVYGLLLILLIVRPQGLFGKAEQREKL
ncbi:MAG: branched-chain amino acid ABC transporter permease [Pseudomonadota bacterium]